jgi:hypothetical protein
MKKDDLKERTSSSRDGHPPLQQPAENGRSAGAWQTIAPLGNVRGGNPPGSVSRTKAKSEFVAKCGDSFRELEESSFLILPSSFS